MRTLESAEPNEAQRLEAEVKELSDQLALHQSTFEIQDESEGVGYIAQRGVKRKAEEISNLRQKAPTELKTQLEQPPVGILTKQEIGQWLWRQENLSKDPNTMPKNLNARADTLIKQWLEQGLEIYLTSDSKIAFDKSLRDAYDAERSSRQPKTLQEEYISPYKDSMYGEAEKVTLAPGWEFQTGEIISTADRIAEEIIDNSELNQTNPVKVNPTVFGEAASTIDDFAYDRVLDKPYPHGEGRRYEVGQTEDGVVLGYKHYRQKFTEDVDVGRIGDLDSGRGIDYNRLPKELINQLKTDGIEVEAGKEGVYVGEQLTKLMNGEKLPLGKSSQIITELYGLWFAKEPSHPWKKGEEKGTYDATFEHQKDLIYSKMITQLMASSKIDTLQEALNLHPASYGGAQAGARRVTGEMQKKQNMPEEKTKLRLIRDERYKREKATIQKWFEMYEKQLVQIERQPSLENLEKFIQENI